MNNTDPLGGQSCDQISGLGSSQYIVYAVLGALCIGSEALGLTKYYKPNTITEVVLLLFRRFKETPVKTNIDKSGFDGAMHPEEDIEIVVQPSYNTHHSLPVIELNQPLLNITNPNDINSSEGTSKQKKKKGRKPKARSVQISLLDDNIIHLSPYFQPTLQLTLWNVLKSKSKSD